jgi:hypothetical protein
MKKLTIAVGISALLWSGLAGAENWVTVFDDEQAEISGSVDKDSIRRGADNLVYYTSNGADKADKAADCKNRIAFTLKLYVMNGIDYPDWRKDGRPVVPGSVGDAMLQFACANA